MSQRHRVGFVMTHEEHEQVLRSNKIPQPCRNMVPKGAVQSGEGFVQEEYPGVGQKGPAQRNSLLFSSR